jgi:hypothetical protein
MIRTTSLSIPRLALAVTVAATAILAGPGGAPANAQDNTEAAPQAPPPACTNSCRGLGIEKVQAGEEHCGLVPRAIKDEALDAACRLAELHREALEARAEERSRGKCSQQTDEPACECRTELREWQNVYTHVLSQNCWTECGWAAFTVCAGRPAADAD